MARRTLPLALALAAAIAAVAALRPVAGLEIANAARGAALTLPVGAGLFAVTSRHSMYDAPVTEEFAVRGDGRIVLEAVSSPSAAVREYFGLTAAGERHAVRRELPELVFRVAAGAPQELRVREERRSFLEFGDHGDRLVVRAVRRPALAAWLAARAAPPRPGDRAP
jgi:hypothetical protein